MTAIMQQMRILYYPYASSCFAMLPSSEQKSKGYPIVSARRIFAGKGKHRFRQRGKEITRIEALSDAVFAFSISLLIVSLEVPQTFRELWQIQKNFLPFVATVCLVMLFWCQQYRFFRNYGLNDLRVIVLNIGLLLMVLFYVYPLKFLFSLLFSMFLSVNFFQKASAMGEVVVTVAEFPKLVNDLQRWLHGHLADFLPALPTCLEVPAPTGTVVVRTGRHKAAGERRPH